MTPFVLGIILIIIGLALPAPIAIFVINPILLKPSYKGGESNLGLREDLDHPFEGISRMALVPLGGVDKEIPDAKARKQLQFSVEKGHTSLKMNIVLYCLNKKGEEVPFDGVAYTNSSPYEIGDDYVINLPVKTVSVGVAVVELDGEAKEDKGYVVNHAPVWKLILGSLLFGLLLALMVMFIYMGMQCIWNSSRPSIVPFYFVLPFLFGYGMSTSTMIFYAAFFATLIAGTLVNFFVMKSKKGVKKGANHG